MVDTKYLINHKNTDGTYSNVGMNTRTPASGIKTLKGAIKRAEQNVNHKHGYRQI